MLKLLDAVMRNENCCIDCSSDLISFLLDPVCDGRRTTSIFQVVCRNVRQISNALFLSKKKGQAGYALVTLQVCRLEVMSLQRDKR